MKRLEQTTKKLISLNLYEDYDDIFRGWLDDGIIEKVPAEQHDAEAFYLPHRPVVKLSSGTTPIRPVFDASSKVYRSPSLNYCLEKGPNLIEMIPNLMLRFRNGKFGVVADIKKAFLQIEVNERDRDYLRFLWYSQNREKTEVFRHRRVVFGVNCSPFILGAVIEYHLSNVRPEHKPLAQRLQKSFYVDNLVTSVNSFEELQDLKLTATSIMDNARLELSRWEHSLDVTSDTYPFERAEISKVLGVCWDKREDCLSCEIPVAIPPKITKRSILSCLAQIYDPIGFLSPILIKPKILLQKAWTLKLAWDDELDRHYKDELSLWFDDLQLHKGMAIPRNFNPLMVPQKDWQIHTFVDASSEAYAAVVFLRTRVGDKVEVHMMAAKSRVAPLKRPTIPRLELLACVVGARLNKMIFEALELKDIKNVFWSDATTALAWIKRDDQWGTFVGNRVKEICRLSDPVNWRYVPSEFNPADLPSRGCSLSRLIQSRWYKDLNKEEICAERKKTAVVTTVKSTDHWYMKYFSSFIKNVRMMAWIRQFINNLQSSTKVKGELSVREIDEAELALLKLVQAECFPGHSMPGLKAEKWENYTVGSSKRQRVGKFSDLEDALFNWFTQKRANNIIITDDLLREKAKKLGEHLDVPENFAYSSGWLQRFKGRFHISQRRLCGEGASISPAIIDEHLTNLNSILANAGYDPANIYNADETGLFFQLIPDRTLAHKDENCRGVKRMKQRITVLLCCNSTGTDKRRLLIIGKSAKPRCFRNFSPHFYCTYTSNSKAWMNSSIFQEWLLQFNKQLVSEGRRILLLLDNATSHCVPNDSLSNIKIHFLPPNMTASLQPLDSGIIKSFKAQYRKLQLQKMVELADAHLPTELRLDYAVRYCKMAWDSVSPDSISNCWNHTGIIRFTSTAAVEPLNYGNLLDRIRDIFAITPENLMTEREFQLVDDSQEAEMKLTDDNFLVSTVTAKEELGEDDDATVTQRLPSLREARTAAETVLLFLEHSKRATPDDVNLSADLFTPCLCHK
ncbi:hypothetical protein LAZ67_8003210 [Cordylochernes scorpioides]|uniref:HTH CENPB-type domain-containing protein n=1 Tax=Cordylochernes scorpioides TaxID=51811 RepID=A0ABY6KRF9_9ARAC|nr:hypothetical protein LAZ67_8003210 [Cordylochernes scorpioides]